MPIIDVIVSLVRTRNLGFLSDTSRLELALSRSSTNSIILGSADLFASTDKFFESLVAKQGSSLVLAGGQVFTNVEEISKYVYDLSLQR